MNGLPFILKARTLVAQYEAKYRDNFISIEDVTAVWFRMKNLKVILITNLGDGSYYEVTHNGDKRETYIDVYQKVHNIAVPDNDIEPEDINGG